MNSKWSPFEILFLSVFLIAAAYINFQADNGVFNFSVAASGILCVVLTAKGKVSAYFFGLYNTVSYAYLAHINGLYGELGLNLIFFTPMNFIGFFLWQKNLENGLVKMRKLTAMSGLLLTLSTIICTVILGYLLSLIESQNTPFIDASTNILSIAATILMTLRYKEQWLLYIVLNILTIIMWYQRHRSGSQEGEIMILMWVGYLINSFYGYINWSRYASK
ncbi:MULTISPECIES: nicotinamide riboside transporter PnuC [unclassified Imperialibacter]|uniref:nicotinamide riboside transporter PnuC n=1 Tax=unclassified Imperialibacter TaxID=2629706 RepID=UPI00125B98F5|nr:MULTISPECIES: nicotinamide riboside transporter PnuC [unclassified Imperialibacter]CAD5299382.1 Nicotinamide mononucleotide transporter PnuC [Imperialibacter sp. 89]CAD5299968.1 Nicotinamide mononucleotide transporter PnuC [Imperialibacter sp. 75]VVT15529.1 Nicotinamide mononucleotide transporter PnuC [Imperialibacter sp. EC-SDR9]